jgi:hypothetical protein
LLPGVLPASGAVNNLPEYGKINETGAHFPGLSAICMKDAAQPISLFSKTLEFLRK